MIWYAILLRAWPVPQPPQATPNFAGCLHEPGVTNRSGKVLRYGPGDTSIGVEAAGRLFASSEGGAQMRGSAAALDRRGPLTREQEPGAR